MKKLYLLGLFLVSSTVMGSCQWIINIGNEKVDSYCLFFPADENTNNTDTSVVCSCFNADGVINNGSYREYYGPTYASSTTMISLPIFIEDRDMKGSRVLCQIVDTVTGGSGINENYLYIVPDALETAYLPAGMSMDELITKLDALMELMTAGTLSWSDAKTFLGQMQTTGYPFCGTVNSAEGLKITHANIFGN
jgi:hypothetical protein